MDHVMESDERSTATAIPSTFLRNLYGFLNNNDLPDTIAWDADGRSFSILDPEKMESSLPMPNLYRGRFKTFKMQLEKHGFMKSRDGTRYFRPDFVKGQPQHLGDVSSSMGGSSPPVLPDERRTPMSLECRIQMPRAHEAKKRRLADDMPTTNSSGNLSWAVKRPTSGLLCSVNVTKPRPTAAAHSARETTVRGSASVMSSQHHSVMADASLVAHARHQHPQHHYQHNPSGVPSLRPPAAQNHLPRLPSLHRAFPLFGLQSQRPSSDI
ncbi:hypothetical protein SPRG_19263 [Saprolegnia parasitica CBS 223.65]|uniref:HSF-type DNA-binding domain-containing protein n=1 Tax=Saprolegnia parasitica (strain CBS 223.65) TaxID=695850 RepID=A0A067D4K9_SAPPC|nr:hypothetical protein SPRG_19263 [Saprolegnia parasitica CBS 223.65]KDO33646.1 hypothetical protein SPRG_19263 [Saprolegnia parasitica CBS 223.65]|eukprot:XP_012195680.1 hypothetical protein SPRG_19263 [Saprolegnia parasitica CBS 223.65]